MLDKYRWIVNTKLTLTARTSAARSVTTRPSAARPHLLGSRSLTTSAKRRSSIETNRFDNTVSSFSSISPKSLLKQIYLKKPEQPPRYISTSAKTHTVDTAVTRGTNSKRTRSTSVFMGDNIVNFYAGQPPLNRVAFQRHSSDVMNKHLNDPAAKFIVYKDIKPLVKKDSPGEILFLSREQVGDRVGTDFAEAPSGAEKDVAKLHESARIPYTLPALVFLGIDDRSSPTTNESSKVDHLNPTGTPYFALDAGMNDWEDLLAEVGGEWGDARASAASMSNWDAGVFAQGRALVDWNTRNKFCPACGTATYSLWAGWKRNCTSAIHPVEGKEPCFSTKGLHNFAYPRTDPVIIMGILDSTGDKILLGRQKSWPKGMYSCLAGFIEPGESFEDAVRREVLEEAGIEVGPVRYSSSQPWPYPSNLMVGCFGRAKDGQTIRLDLDNELEDAQWFPRSVISSIVSSPTGSAYTKSDLNKLDEKTQTQTQSQSQVKSHADKDAESSAALAPSEKTAEEISDIQKKQGDGLGITRVPPDTAIAGQLVRLWVKGGLDLVSKL